MGARASVSPRPKIEGFCDPKYEKVKKHLEYMLTKGFDENVQLCVYVEDKCVIDLYGTSNDTYDGNKTQTIFSSGKSIEAIVMGMLYEKGLFKYEDKISQYWPEFGENGKSEIKICDVLRHESGLAYFSKPLASFENAWTENIKKNQVGELIEQEEQHFPKEKDGIKFKREYHHSSRGMIINELVRRLHPEGKTIGEILRDEVEISGIYSGMKEEEFEQVYQVRQMTNGFVLAQSLTPKWAGKKLNITFFELMKMMKSFGEIMKEMEHEAVIASELEGHLDDPKWVDFLQNETGLKAEGCSFNTQANAKGLGKLASIMANKGQGLMSEKTWNEIHSEPTTEYDASFYMLGKHRSRFTKGGLCFHENLPDANEGEKEHLNKNREGFYGWFGYGGSIFQWNPELKIGFAFIPTVLDPIVDQFNERGAVLQQLVKDCLTT